MRYVADLNGFTDVTKGEHVQAGEPLVGTRRATDTISIVTDRMFIVLRDRHQDDPCEEEVRYEEVQSENLDAGKGLATLRKDARATTHNRRKK